jgi:D-glycero-D-manno-heptose 1,7-bisphosphate phosphatase
MKQPAVFIDRDGTIAEEVGYVNHPSRFQLYPYAPAAIRLLNANGWLAIIVTNQAGVARGYLTEDLVIQVNELMKQQLKSQDARLDAIYYCAHHPSAGEPPYRLDCDCRKPKAGLIKIAIREFEIDLASSWMVGDRYTDVELARNANVRSALVLSGYGRGEWEYHRASWRHQPDLVGENLLEVVKSVINLSGYPATVDQPLAIEAGS